MLDSDFYLAGALVQPRLNRITRNGCSVQIEPKLMQVLGVLAANPGRVVERDAILREVWKDTAVVEQVLTRAVSELRRHLGDKIRQPTVIETIPKSGYRLIAPLTPAGTPEPAQGQSRGRRSWFLGRGPLAIGLSLSAILLALLSGVRRDESSAPPEGWKITPLTSFAGWEYDPALSPDGRQVAFAWNGPQGKSWDIHLRLIGTESAFDLTPGEGAEGSPAWSPDGLYVAYYRRSEEGTAIYKRPALGGLEQRLAVCRADYTDLDWSPDGRLLAFNQRIEDGPLAIFLLDLESLASRQLSQPAANVVGDFRPRFSPDGQTLAFARTRSEGLDDIYRIDLPSGAETRLTPESHGVYGLDWTDDGRELVYASRQSGIRALRRLPAKGGIGRRLPIPTDNPGNPTIRGSRLVFEEWAMETNLWWLDPASRAAPQPRIQSTRWDMHPSFSGDGERIAFTSNRSGSYEIWMSLSGGAEPAKLTSFGGPFVGSPRWSPDDSRIAFDARPQGLADLYLVDAENGLQRRLTHHAADEIAPTWSRDGRHLYFASDRSGRWETWRMNPDEPEASALQVTREGGLSAQESLDGRFLYYAKPHQHGLWRQPLGGGQEELALACLNVVDWGSWALYGSGVYFVRRQGAGADRIEFFDFETRQSEVVMETEKAIPQLDAALALSPQGAILFGQVERQMADLMLVEDFK